MQVMLAQLASSYEQFAPQQPGGTLTKNQRGRLQRTHPLKRRCETLTLRASRPGEVIMRNNLLGQETHCWFRQLRRLQSYLLMRAEIAPKDLVEAMGSH